MNTETDDAMALNLGTLSYRAVPHPGSVIVYSNALGRWGRVPIQEVKKVAPGPALWQLLLRHRHARWMIGSLVAALACMGTGLYGLSQKRAAPGASAVRAAQPTALPTQVPQLPTGGASAMATFARGRA